MMDSEDNSQTSLPIIPASIDIETYPSILDLIIAFSSQATQAKLLRCSKSTFQTVAKSLYRNLALISPQVFALIETGLAFPDTQRSRLLSPYLQYCLHQVHTLHTSYFETFHTDFNNLPDGCLPNLKTVVLHTNRVDFDFDVILPRNFDSMGGEEGWDLYIILSEAVMDSYKELRSHRIRINIAQPPQSCRSVTFIIGRAPRLGAMPLLKILGDKEKGSNIPLSVVLLPWEREEQQVEFETRALQLWSEAKELDFDLDQRRRFIGMECNGFWGDQENLVGCGSQDGLPGGNKGKSNMSFETFLSWLRDMTPDTLFSYEEARKLELASAKLVFSAQEYLEGQFDKHIEAMSSDDFRLPVMIEAKRQNTEAKEEASSVLKAIMARQAL